MRKLMRHNSGELRFIVGSLDRTAIDENVATRKSEGVDRLVVYAVKLKGVLHTARRELGRQPKAQLREVSIHFRIIAEWKLLLCLLRELLALLHVCLR
jgi:hypothetical protein